MPFSGRYQEAAKRYSEALQLIESLDSESFEQLTLTVLLNRTGCNMKLSMWPDVIQDCIRGLAIHPRHPKFLQVSLNPFFIGIRERSCCSRILEIIDFAYKL